jgi:hypothetical protein
MRFTLFLRESNTFRRTSVTRTNKEMKDTVQGAIIVTFQKKIKSLELKYYGHAKNRKTNECQNKLQQLHWKKQRRKGRWASDA